MSCVRELGRVRRVGLTLFWVIWVFGCLGICTAALSAPLIPEAKIDALEQQLKQGASADARSSVASRRAFKNAARKGLALVEKYPEAPNRFRVLGVVVQCRKRMLAMAGTDKNRIALFKPCEKLLDAPDKYAEERLEADLLLSDRDLSSRDATLEERAQALAELLDRYSGTRAEARSLLMGALIVQKLDNRALESHILYTLDEKFADDHEVIEFRRKFLKMSRLDLVFSGKYKRIDGAEIVFPADTMGHMGLMIFWSKNKPGIDKYLESTKSAITNAPGRIDVFSFNVDGLPDGGASVLKEHGLDWTVMKLPGGRRSQAYRSYAQGDPLAVLVNEYGIAVTRPEIVHGRSAAVDGARISDNRYMAQLQSMFTGEFLLWARDGLNAKPVGGRAGGPALPEADGMVERPRSTELSQVKECFVPAPFRYRLKREEAFANDGKAAKLCTEIMGDGEPEDVWRIRDHKIIALLGMWNLGCEPQYLEAAVKEAELTIAVELEPEAQIVSRYCLAKKALRDGSEKPEGIVSGFLHDCGGDSAPAGALAAASLLAIEARSREMHDEYRAKFLEVHSGDRRFYAFTAFLRDRHFQYRVLKANHNLRERRARGYIVGHGYAWPTNYLPDIELKKLDGSTLSMPNDTNGKLTYLLFVEPPAGGGTNNWWLKRDSHGRIRRSSGVHTVMGYANRLTKSYLNGDINFVAAFLTDDADHVKYLVQTNGWECTPVMVPGGPKNPMVRRLGVFSADKFPNVFLLRRDGTITWRGSGLRYKNEFGYPFAVLLAMKVHVEVCEMKYGYKALVRGDFKKAVRIFSGPFPEERPQRYRWRSPRYHAKALAHAGMKDWEGALDAVNKAIDAHKLRHFRGYGRRSKHLSDWRKDAAKVTLKEPCDIICMLWTEKAAILDRLHRENEAVKLRERVDGPTREHYPHIYERFHKKLHNLMITDKQEVLTP